jgi:hypothetical protein
VAAAETRSRPAIDAPAESEAAIRRALGLLPRRPVEVAVVTADRVEPHSRERFWRSEAFFSKGSPVVYLTSHSPVLKAAQEGSSIHVHVLAAIIWHEMAHLEGADEPEAQRREAAMWTRFVRDGLVDRVTALRYLKRLADRHTETANDRGRVSALVPSHHRRRSEYASGP